jgi:tetratricopeptide (TPR) repeat protein
MKPAAFIAVLALAGCVSREFPELTTSARPAAATAEPVVSPPAVAAVNAMPSLHADEQRWRDRAATLARDERLAEAALQWEVLVLLRPDEQTYQHKLKETRGRIVRLVEERQRRAEEARKRNDGDQMVLWHLKTLAIDPDHAGAAQALREMDRERTRRTYLSRGPRAPGTPNMTAQVLFPNESAQRSATPAVKPAPRKPAPGLPTPADLDAGIILYRQGELTSSVESLQRHLQRMPNDGPAKRYLGDAYAGLAQRAMQQGQKEQALALYEKAQGEADAPDHSDSIRKLRQSLAEEYYQRGVRASTSNLRQSIALLEQSLQYDPTHAQAALRLQQARASQRTLDSIEKSKATRP